MEFERNDVEISTKWFVLKPISSSVYIVGFSLTVYQLIYVFALLFFMRVVVPEIVLNLIST
jgi:hypothetical protein